MAFIPQSATLRAIFGYKPTKAELVKRASSESGKSQSVDLWGRTRFLPTAVVFDLVRDDKEQLRAFWEAHRTGSFYGYDYDTEDVTTQALGTGDGSSHTFTTLARDITTVTVFDNASPVSSSGYTISNGTGANGEDQIVFVTAPVNTHVLTITYTGRRRYLMEFWQAQEIEPLNVNLWRVTWYLREAF